jgi:hypothetical protein
MPDSESKEYFKSNRLAHDVLLIRSMKLLDSVRKQWAQGVYHDMAISWPDSEVDYMGEVSAKPRVAVLTGTDHEKAQGVTDLVLNTRAYAVVVVKRHGDGVNVIFESAHGASGWRIPLERHGDVLVPVEAVTLDKPYLGILWRPNQAEA